MQWSLPLLSAFFSPSLRFDPFSGCQLFHLHEWFPVVIFFFLFWPLFKSPFTSSNSILTISPRYFIDKCYEKNLRAEDCLCKFGHATHTYTHTNTQAHTDTSNKVILGKILGYENSNNCEEDSSSYRIWRHEVVFGGGKKILWQSSQRISRPLEDKRRKIVGINWVILTYLSSRDLWHLI